MMKLFRADAVHSSGSKEPDRHYRIAAPTFRRALEKAEKISKKGWDNRVVSVTEEIGQTVEVA